jgi:hypothetical protein
MACNKIEESFHEEKDFEGGNLCHRGFVVVFVCINCERDEFSGSGRGEWIYFSDYERCNGFVI